MVSACNSSVLHYQIVNKGRPAKSRVLQYIKVEMLCSNKRRIEGRRR